MNLGNVMRRMAKAEKQTGPDDPEARAILAEAEDHPAYREACERHQETFDRVIARMGEADGPIEMTQAEDKAWAELRAALLDAAERIGAERGISQRRIVGAFR